ncbi:MAG TPA: efflux RND transporter periplasmic adaptor subunit [Thermodesulfobacteriota bacterium]|jgi:RND family efflux transporter MFP subunit|nr:efflux RND transporter periplasmic adaptor subunit [Thermodesulfobacteriota bacterium]
MMKRLKAISVFACHSIIAISVAACSGGADKKESEGGTVPVVVGKIQKVQERETISVSGTVTTPNSPASVSFLVSGKVVFVGPREGDFVKAGEGLATIDPTDYQLTVAAAKAQTDMAKIEYKRAEDEHRRMKMLYDSNSLAPNDYQKFKAAFESAGQQVDQSAASENLARKHLADTTLYAPISGYISKRSVEPGDTASPGHPVFEIVQMDSVEVDVGVPETDVRLVRIGQKAEIKVPALSGNSFQGTVRVLNISADPNTRTYMARIRVPNPEHTLRIGMVAEATIRGDKAVTRTLLPEDAVIHDPQGATQVFVYYPDQKRVYAKRVEIGALREKDLEIRDGLTGDEWIVLAGQTKLRDGAVVSTTEQQMLKVTSVEGVQK